jgi:hypothetical protein
MKKASALWNTLQKRFFKIFKLEELRKNDFFGKIYSTHESRSQVEQFDEKIDGQKPRGTLSLNRRRSVIFFSLFFSCTYFNSLHNQRSILVSTQKKN